MNNLSVLLSLLIVFISCSSSNDYHNQVFCKNELTLLGSFENLPQLNKNITKVRDRNDSSLVPIFDSQGFFARYRVTHTIDKRDFLLKMGSFDMERYPGVPPAFNPYVNEMQVYLTKSDSIYIRREKSSLDSIRQEVLQRYNELSLERFQEMYFALYWDQETDANKLNSVITEIIFGYLEVANNFSNSHFENTICQLDSTQVDSLAKLIPFQIKTDFFGSEKYDKWDFIPVEIPNEP